MSNIINITEKIEKAIKQAFPKFMTPIYSKIKDTFYSKEEVDDKLRNVTVNTSDLLNKSIYDTDNDGILDKSKIAVKIEGVEKQPFFSVYGKSPNGKEGFYKFPIGFVDDQTNKFQSVRQNAKSNEVYTIELIKPNKLNDLIIQAYEFVQGEQDVVTTLKEFNNSDSNNFYYDKNNVEFDNNGCKIKNEYQYNSIKNTETNLYELDLSNENFIGSISNIDMEVNS